MTFDKSVREVNPRGPAAITIKMGVRAVPVNRATFLSKKSVLSLLVKTVM
jgi:hypothetical protein